MDDESKEHLISLPEMRDLKYRINKWDMSKIFELEDIQKHAAGCLSLRRGQRYLLPRGVLGQRMQMDSMSSSGKPVLWTLWWRCQQKGMLSILDNASHPLHTTLKPLQSTVQVHRIQRYDSSPFCRDHKKIIRHLIVQYYISISL